MNTYLPQKVKITKIDDMSPTVRLLRLAPTLRSGFEKDENNLSFIPAQFVLVGKIGYGESPFGILSSPYENKYFEIAVRNTGGLVTNFLHRAKEGEIIDLRGPFGNGFPLEFFEGKDLVAVTGGCGVPPIAGLIEYIIANRAKFWNVYLLYGAKTPEELLLVDRMKGWQKNDIKIMTTIDKPAEGWKGNVGFVPDLIKDIKIDESSACAVMCGPGPMVNAIAKVLRPLGISDRRTFVSLERKMQCGIGKCQHCATGGKYVCKNGPVFNLDEVDNNWD